MKTARSRFLPMLLAILMTLSLLPAVALADGDVITEVNITYDASAAFPTVRATGEQVSRALYAAVTNPTSSSNNGGADWYIYGNTDGTANHWCCLVYANGNDFDPNDYAAGFTELHDSTEPLTADKDYYLKFNPCPYNKQFDQENLPTVKVNGESADMVYRNSTELVVYKRVEMNETGNFAWSLDLEPTQIVVQKGATCQFTADVEATSNVSATWSVLDANAVGTTVSSSGLLTVAADETASSLTVRAQAGKFVREAKVTLVDDPPYIGGVSFTGADYSVQRGGSVNLSVEVTGTDLPGVDWSLSGNTDDDTHLESEYNYGRVSSVYLVVSTEEHAETLTVRATSQADPTKFAETTVTVAPGLQSLNITYDAEAVAAVLDTAHTGQQVAIALYAAVTSPTSSNNGGADWYIFGSTDGTASHWCCLVYANGNAFNPADHRAGFTELHDSTDPLTADKDYYLKFNPCPNAQQFDQENLPAVTVNGESADMVYRNGTELVVYKRVYLAGQAPALPADLASVTAAAQPGKIVVSWSAANGADHYRIARQTTGEGWTLLNGNYNGTSYEDTTAVAGKRYHYLVCAENEVGKGGSATSAVVTALAAVIPDAVASVTATAQPGKIVVTWTAAASADHYRIARQTTGEGWTLLNGNYNGTSYEDTTAVAGKRYRYLVCAENEVGKGGSATSAVVTALAPAALPAAVASVTATAQPGKIVVTWTAAENADHYRIARQTTGEAWTLLNGNYNGTSYEDTTAVAGKRYHYLVCAENEVGKGGSATSAVAIALAPAVIPDAVASVTATAQPGKIVVSWPAAASADHYRIARQSTGTNWTLLDGNFSGLTYTDNSVEAGKRYRYTVCGENELGKGTGATSVAVEALPALTIPGAVESISAAAQPGKIVVTWTAAASADHYRIARQSTGTNWMLLDGNFNGLTYTDTSVEAGKRYRYTVCGENELGKGTGATSVAVEALPALTIPGAVESISAAAQPGRIVVTWTAAENAEHYRLARQSTGTSWTLLDGNISGLTFTDDTVEAGKRYRYTVCGENELGKGTGATSVAVEALPALTIPGAVENISAEAQPGKIVVTWTAAENAEHYRIARQSTGTNWMLLDGNFNGLTYTDNSVEAGKRYRYTVCAENELGKGSSATSIALEALS